MHTHHVISLCHIPADRQHFYCAFQSRCVNFAYQMKSLGHKVLFYAPENSVAFCDDFIPIISTQEIMENYGIYLPEVSTKLKWDINEPIWKIANSNSIREINKRIQPGDFIDVIGGFCHKPIADAFPNNKTVEFGIGYDGAFSEYRIYDSYTHMACVAGQQYKHQEYHSNWAVIPNSYHLSDFPFISKKQEYLVYLGRMVKSKGVDIAVEVARKHDLPIFLAGQGVRKFNQAGHIICDDLEVNYSKAKYLGVLNIENKARLLGNALATLVPTRYTEPFGGCNVESQICGTGVITSDNGCFSETVEQGKTGFRCRTQEQFNESILHIRELNYQYIRERAISKWDIDIVKHQYNAYYHSIQ